MKRYLVICEETCPKCDGKGELALHNLVHWHDDAPKHLSEPEGFPCPECNGTKVIRKEVDLAEAMGRPVLNPDVIAQLKAHGMLNPGEAYKSLYESQLPERPRPPAGDIVKEGTRPVKGPEIKTINTPVSPKESQSILRAIKALIRW